MARGKALAVAQQAQAVQQANISKQESLELVQCLLRVVSYLRGLFNDSYFNELHMDNLDGMTIKTLKPIDEESTRLIDWVEQGVADALKEGYIQNLFFGISTDKDGDNLLEEYIYTFTYGEDGQAVGLNLTSNSKGKRSGKISQKATVDTVRYEVCRLIRMLVEISQTLDKVPADRFLFMKMTYTDIAPLEYEPPMFQPLSSERLCRFKSNPFKMFLGGVNTQHHCVKLSVKSVLDACGDDGSEGYAEDEEEMEGSRMLEGLSQEQGGDSMLMGQDERQQHAISSRTPGKHASDGAGRATEQAAVQSAAVQPSGPQFDAQQAGGMGGATQVPKAGGSRLTQEELKRRAQEDELMMKTTEAQPTDSCAFPPDNLNDDDTQLSGGAMAGGDGAMDMEAEQQLPQQKLSLSQGRAVTEQLPSQQRREVFGALRAFCARRTRVDLDDACLQFPEAPMELLDSALKSLVEEGALQVGTKAGQFLVVPAQSRRSHASAQPERLANQLNGLNVADGAAPSGAGAKVDKSIMGRVQSTHAGSELTFNKATTAPAPPSVAAGAAAEDSMMEDAADNQEAPPNYHFEASQQSHAAPAKGGRTPSRPKKASMVAAPIQQQSLKKKKATPAKVPGNGGRSTTRAMAKRG